MGKVIIVDDHPVVINGLRSILEDVGKYTVTGEAVNIKDAMKLLRSEIPDVMIIDVELGNGMSGIELVKRVREHFPGVRMLVMSMDDGAIYAERAIRAGARGFISKADTLDNIITAIDTVSNGEMYLSVDLCSIIVGSHFRNYFPSSPEPDIVSLTDRELEVFQLAGRGYKRGEIAEKLQISVSTVEVHRRNIKKKMSISTSSELAKIAIKHAAERFKIQP